MYKRNEIPQAENPDYEITYNTNALLSITTERNMPQKSLMSTFGMTNPSTVKNWFSGFTCPPIDRLCYISTRLDIDLLQFITYFGHHFKTKLKDLFLLEKAGITVSDILVERGIKPTETPSSFPVLKDEDLKRRYLKLDSEATMAREANELYINRQAARCNNTPAATASASMEIIDRILALQREASNHEAEALANQRREMQQAVDKRDDTIMQLQKQLATAQAELQLLHRQTARDYYGAPLASIVGQDEDPKPNEA